MRMIGLMICSVVFLLLTSVGQTQVTSVPPKGWTTMTPVYDFSGRGLRRLNLTNNTPDEIRKELLDTNTLRLIAKRNGLSDKDVATVQIAQENGEVEVYATGHSGRAYTMISDDLRYYGVARDEGHTRDFCLAAITNKTDLSTVTDPNLRAFLKERPMLPADRLRKSGSRTFTNKAGTINGQSTTIMFVNGKFETTNFTDIQKNDEIKQSVTYVLVDGEIAWEYAVDFRQDGTVDQVGSVALVSESRCDAKEYEPKNRQAIKEAREQAEAEIKTAGIHRFGSGHAIWARMQKKLKDKGIDWHSPAELNPNTSFD